MEIKELDKIRHADFKKSVDLVEKLRAGRNESDIPLTDKYWDEQNIHRHVHGSK